MHTSMNTRDMGIAVAVAFLWATNVIFTKLAMASMSPLAFNFLRMISVLPLMTFFPLHKVPLKSVVPSAIIMGVGHYGLLALGLQLGAGAAIAGLLLQLNPFFSALCAYLILKSPPNKYHLWGFLPALAGIIYGCYYAPSQGVAMGYLYVLASALCGGLGNVYLKIALGPTTSSQEMTAFVVGFAPIAAPILLIFMIVIEGFEDALWGLTCMMDWKNIVYVVYAGWVSMVLGVKYWTKLLNKYSIAVVSPYTLLVPVFSLILASCIGETINHVTLVAVLLIFCGLLVSQISSLQRILKEKHSH